MFEWEMYHPSHSMFDASSGTVSLQDALLRLAGGKLRLVETVREPASVRGDFIYQMKIRARGADWWDGMVILRVRGSQNLRAVKTLIEETR